MIDWERLKETSLAESLEPRPARDLRLNCRALYGGVAWPGKLAGFAVVLAMSRSRHFDSGDIYLLDEYETFDTRELVRQCDVLRFKYRVETWIGDIRNDAADRFINELNSERDRNLDPAMVSRSFYLTSTPMLEMEQLYPYILPQIKMLLDKPRRQLFLRDSKILNYLSAIEPAEIADLQFGDFPAVEALAFAAIEMQKRVADSDRFRDYPESEPERFMFSFDRRKRNRRRGNRFNALDFEL